MVSPSLAGALLRRNEGAAGRDAGRLAPDRERRNDWRARMAVTARARLAGADGGGARAGRCTAMFFAAALLCDGVARALARELHRQDLFLDRQLDWVGSLLLTAVCVRIFPVIASARRTRTRLWLSAYKRLRRPLRTWELVTCAVFLFPLLLERHVDPPTYSGAKTWAHFVILFLYSRMFLRASLRTWRLQRVEVSRQKNRVPRWIDPGGRSSGAGI